jgi:DNA-binding IclR family transcriptional regulator
LAIGGALGFARVDLECIVASKLKSNPKHRHRNGDVDLAVTLIVTLASSQGASASELASRVGGNPRRVLRILSTLNDRRFVSMDPLNLYWLGPQLLSLGGRANASNALIYASSEVMEDILDRTQESVGLTTRVESEILLVAFRGSPIPFPIPPLVATRAPLYKGGGAKLLLAYAPLEVIDQVIAQHLNAFEPSSIRTREEVLQLLDKIRLDGFYICVGEPHPDVFTITAPVRDSQNRVVAAIGVMGSTSRLSPEHADHAKKSVLEGAKRISSRLG